MDAVSKIELISVFGNMTCFSDVIWIRDNSLLSNPERHVTAYSQKFITTLNDISSSESGDYQCIAKSKDDISRNYTLHIEVRHDC